MINGKYLAKEKREISKPDILFNLLSRSVR